MAVSWRRCSGIVIMRLLFLCLCLSLLGVPSVGASPEIQQERVVIYFFWGDGCPHCENAKPFLADLSRRYPSVAVNAYEVWYNQENQELFKAMAQAFNFEPGGVPTLFVGDQYFVGFSEQIGEEIEAYVVRCLDTGCSDAGAGIVSPEVSEEVPEEEIATSVLPGVEETGAPTNWRERFAQDLVGNLLSVFVLAGMVGAVVYRGVAMTRKAGPEPVLWRQVALPLVILGLIVAGYLAYVETQDVPAVCGPVGDCNSVQQSEYARLFGILPIAVLGLMGYVGIGMAWAVARYAQGRKSALAKLALVGMVWFGILFSIYLTFLEPFVIGATCAWCLTSAVVMTALFLLLTPLLPAALTELRAPQRRHRRA